MADLHSVTLSLGSNINAEENIPKAVELLRNVGKIKSVSSVWESKSVGFDGPNFLNACLIFLTSIEAKRFKEEVIRPIETQIGRVRGAEKNSPAPLTSIFCFMIKLRSTRIFGNMLL